MAVTLGEILQSRGDADYAQGGYGGAVPEADYNTAAANQYFQHAADLQYNANRYLAEQHDRNLQDALKNVNGIDFNNLLPQDREALMPEYADVLKNTKDNFSVLKNPLSNPDAWAKLRQGESNLRSKLSQSQQDAVFLGKQQEFVQNHPEFNSPAYQQQVKAFLATPVGQRQHFTITPPTIFNPEAAYKAVSELSKKKYATATSNGKYITEEEGDKIDRDKYNALTKAGALPGTDAYGRSWESLRRQQFDELPANLKAGFDNDYNKFVESQAKNFMAEDQQGKKSIKGDPYGEKRAELGNELTLLNKRQGFEAGENEKNRENALLIAGIKAPGSKDGKVSPEALGEFKNKVYHQMLTSNTNAPDHTDKLNAINKNPNLTVTQKIEQMDAVAADPNNYLQTVNNALLQNIYGDNTQLDNKLSSGVKTSDGISSSKTLNQKLPATSIIGNRLSNDKNDVILTVRNNLTGAVDNRRIPKEQFYNDLNNLAGEKFAPEVSKAGDDWLKKHTGEIKPDLDKINSIINPGTAPQVKGLSDEAYNEFKRKNGLQ